MTRERDRPDLDDALLPPLDAEPGPMPPLSAAEADAVAWGAVSRWAAGLPGVEPTDDGVGPAKPLSAERAAQLAQRVVALQAARSRGPHLPPWAAKVAAVLVACGISAVSFAAYRQWSGQPESVQRQLRDEREHAPPSAASVDDSTPPRAEDNSPSTANSKIAPSPNADLPAKPRAASEERVPPEELLARANALRAQRHWVAAERLYRQALNAAAASSEQRYVALVACASLNLQHLGKPARALWAYQAALALMPHGDLSEEAQLGIADCQHALGERELERRALDVFIELHPDSSWIDGAQRRRSALE